MTSLVMFASLVGIGLLLIALGIPMWKEMVPQNRIYGFKTPLTLSNKEVWYKANAIGGRDITIGGLFLVLAGLPMPLLPETAASIAASVAAVAIILVTMGHTFWKTSAYLADMKDQTAEPAKAESTDLPKEMMQTLNDERPLADRTKKKTTE
ncbi:MAG: SdpI family protein [Proteobacteria bacterium]|nr:SdpI family protein [Pseudomonadota bacterium]